MTRYSFYRPWATEPWHGFDELRREMDALLGRFDGLASSERHGVFPAANLYQDGDAYVLTAELPGVRSEDIEVSLEGPTVMIRGERKIDYSTDEDTSAHRLERQSGSFRRAFELPMAVEAEKVSAIHKNGVLMLRLPKAPENRPRQIVVQSD